MNYGANFLDLIRKPWQGEAAHKLKAKINETLHTL
jgi:hypothetical protein